MSGAAAGPAAGGRRAESTRLALCPELEHSLSLLEPGGGRAEQQQRRERRADAAPVPVVFVCAGCGRPGGGATRSRAFSGEESGCILLRGVAARVAAGPEPQFSELPGECGCGGPVLAAHSPGGVGRSRGRRRGEARTIETFFCSGC
ncbi:LOW QUALITY PROTEIN: protein Mis18-alpha-like [Chamaea fasciata]|uniref:LOW QUALITY PROTEIN: protein Mis18-alpha-like n=1 Tax=Chamaea fasciata TaxID=190680 RepID=UPI00336A5EED